MGALLQRAFLARFALLLAAAAASACTTNAANPVQESLDETNGTTLTRLQKPLTFIAAAARGANLDPFAFIGPFETNRMGARRLYLWIAVPVEGGGDASVALRDADGAIVEAKTAFDAQQLGLSGAPYRTTATWQRQFVVELDAQQFARLTSAPFLEVGVRHSAGADERFVSEQPTLPYMQEFRAQLGL